MVQKFINKYDYCHCQAWLIAKDTEGNKQKKIYRKKYAEKYTERIKQINKYDCCHRLVWLIVTRKRKGYTERRVTTSQTLTCELQAQAQAPQAQALTTDQTLICELKEIIRAQSSTVDKVTRYGRNGIRTSKLLEKQFFHDWLWSVNRGEGQLASVTIQRRQWTILERYLNNIWTQARMFRCAGQIVFGENRCGRCLECQVKIVSGQD